MMILKRETGALEPRRQGNGGGHGKLARLRDWVATQMKAKPNLMLDDLVLKIADAHEMTVHRVSVWRTLQSLGLTQKKTCKPSSKSGLRYAKRAISGSRGGNRSWPTCCRA
jgi:transposase